MKDMLDEAIGYLREYVGGARKTEVDYDMLRDDVCALIRRYDELMDRPNYHIVETAEVDRVDMTVLEEDKNFRMEGWIHLKVKSARPCTIEEDL